MYHYRATNTQYCELLIYPLHYNVLSCQSWNFPHHDPRARARGVCDEAPTNKKNKDIKMIKMEKKDAQRIKRNRARSDRRRRAHQRLMAAEEAVHTKMQSKRWYAANGDKLLSGDTGRDLQREKQRKKRRQECKPPNMAAAAGHCGQSGGDSDFAAAALQRGK